VNALANQTVAKMGIPRSQTITTLDIEKAAQEIILSKPLYQGAPLSRIREEPIQRILNAMLSENNAVAESLSAEDIFYAREIGLLADNPPLRLMNPIYREAIAQVLTFHASNNIDLERKSFINAAGMLDVNVIVKEFATWWKRNAAFMLKGNYYSEAAAQLVFMAWLQRVVNGGGIIDREYGVGRGRIDVLIRWPHPAARNPQEWQHEAFELKVWSDDVGDPLEEGLEQLERYLDGLNLTQGTLVIFDRRKEAAPSATRTQISQTQTPKGYAVRLLRA
jgi:hypothetical protein